MPYPIERTMVNALKASATGPIIVSGKFSVAIRKASGIFRIVVDTMLHAWCERNKNRNDQDP